MQCSNLNSSLTIIINTSILNAPANLLNMTNLSTTNTSFSEANILMHEMKRNGVNPNIVTYNTLINGNTKKGHFAEANRLMDEMKNNGMNPYI